MGWPLALAVGISAPSFAQTLPQGGNVVGGAGTITQTSPNQLTINQASQNLAIDWQSFSIGANNIVRFVQPSTSAVALNRVLNGDPSQIYGQIQANGQVVIMSPNGIVFGPSSRIDVNALVATTANISTLDFMAGKLLFDQASSDANARIVNQGVISVAQGGFAVLAAANVSNQGQIVANGGTVVLGGTKTFAIDFHGDGLLKFAATGIVDRKPAGADALVENSGSIEANGGRVLLTARAARSVLDNVINTSGIVVAKTASLVNGEIVIDGGDSGIVRVAGTLDASGAAAGESGGTVKVLGEKVGLFENARIDASGNAGGGTVLVGGNYQGKGPEANAQYLYMDARAVIDASAVSNGDGGKVILWADKTTRFDGAISARGGLLGGNGGFVETSGKIVLRVGETAAVDTGATVGRVGNWLLDPNNITIAAGGGASTNISGNPSFVSTGDSAVVYAATINSAFSTGNVTITTGTGAPNSEAGDITVAGAISNSSAARTLTLSAAGSINITGSIAGSGYALSVVLDAPSGSVSIGGTGINTYGGSLTINAGAGVTQTAALTNSTGGYALNLNLTGASAATLTNAANNFNTITINKSGSGALSLLTVLSPDLQTSTISGGNFSLTGQGFLQTGALTHTGGGSVTIAGGTGNVTLSQANSFAGGVSVTGNTITVSAAQTATGSGSLSLDATRNVVVGASLTTATGDIVIMGNVSSWSGYTTNAPSFGSTAGDFKGVELSGGASITTSGGNIAIAGKGGDGSPGGAPPAGTNQFGISAGASSTISTTGSGYIVMHGYGGPSPYDNPGSGGSHTGIYLNGAASGTAVDISTANGQIKLVGTGNSTGGGSGDNNGGVALLWAKVRSTGSGAIDITGTSATTGTGRGVFIGLSGSEVTGATGNVTITGTGGGTATTGYGFYNAGVEISASGVVRTTGAGSGNVTLVGYSGPGAGNGILFSSTSPVLGSAGMIGNVTLRTDSLGNTSTGLSILHAAGSGTITFRTDTAPTNIVFNGSGGGLQLTSGILGAVSSNFANLAIGDSSQTGTITTGAVYSAPSNRSLSFTTGGDLTVNYALATAGTGSISLTSAKAIALLGNVTTGGGDIVMMGGNVGPWTSPFTNPAPSYGTATGTFVGVAIGAAIQVTAGANGNIAIAGQGGSTGSSQYGIQMYSGAAVSTSGTGTINMVGRGGGNGDGMAIDGATVSSTGSGAIQMVAIPGTVGGGFLFSNSVTLGNAAYAGNLTLRSDGAIAGTASVALPHQNGTGTFTVRTHTDSTQIFAATAGAGLQFASDLLSAASSYGTIVVGSATQTGAIAVGALTLVRDTTILAATAPISIVGTVDLGTRTLELSSGGAIAQSASGTEIIGFGDLKLSGTGGGTVQLTDAGNAFDSVLLNRGATSGNITISTTADVFVEGQSSTGALSVSGPNISVANALTSAGGSIRLTATESVDVSANIATGGGNIVLLGNASWAGAPTGTPSPGMATGNFVGVSVAGATINAGTGGIYIAGVGGDDTGGSQHGVVIDAGATVAATGPIKIYGQGGANAGNYNSGITIDGGTINAGAGGLTIVGTGGAGSGTLNLGLYAASSATIAGGGGGAMNISGTGGALSGAGISLNGVAISAAGASALTLSGDSAATYGIEGFGIASSLSTATGAMAMNANGDVYLPATAITTTSAPLTVTTAGAAVLTNAGNAIVGATTINATGSSATVNFNNSVANRDLSIASTGALALGTLTFGGNLTASAAGQLAVNAPLSMAAGKNVTLTSTGAAADILVVGNVVLSNGTFTANSDRSIQIGANVATNGGDIVMYANAPGGNVNTGTGTGTFHGVRIDGSLTVDAGGGNIDIRGRSGDSGTFHGVTIRNGAGVLTSGIGTLDISGHGGTSVAGGSAGVEFYAGGAYAETQNGALTVTGYGSTGGSTNNPGVALATGQIRATGTGTVYVAGAGGAGGSTGVSVQGGGTTLISAVDGNLTVIGNGGTGSGGGFESWGINVAGQAGVGTIQSTGTGSVTVSGTAGGTTGNGRYGIIVGSGGSILATHAAVHTLSVTGTGGSGTGTDNHGIYLTGAGATISAVGFNVSLNGTGGTGGTGSDGIRLDSGANVHSDNGQLTLTGTGTGTGYGIAASGTVSTIGDPTAAGNIELVADTMLISAATLGIATDGQVDIRPLTSGATIGVGGGGSTLQLPGNMNFVDAALLVIGDGNAGTVTVGAGGISTATGVDLGLRGASIALNGNVTLGLGDTLTLYANTSGVTQAVSTVVTTSNLVLRGAGDFAVNRVGNSIANVAANVTAGSGTGAIALYTGAVGSASSKALTDGIGTVNGITTPAGLTWVASNGLTQTAAGVLSVGGATNLTAQNGTLDMSVATNSFSGTVAATSGGGGSILLKGGTLALGAVNSAGNVILNATSGGINQAGLLTANGNLNASTNGGPLALSTYSNVVAGSVSLATAGGYNLAWGQSGPMLVGSISSSGQLDISVTGGGIAQTGAISTAGPTTLSVNTGNIVLTNPANAFVGAIVATNTAGGISLANTGATLFGNVVSNGVLNVSVTGGALSQTNGTAISTTGNATVTLAGAYAMTLAEAGNNVGGNLVLSGSTGTLNGTLGGAVTVTAGTFVVNGTTIGTSAPPPTNTTAPAPGAGVGGTTVSSALTDAAPISQIQAAANLPPPPPPIAASGSSILALLSTPPPVVDGGGGAPGPAPGAGGPGAPAVAGGPGAPGGPGGPGEGGEGGPAVSPVGVVVAPPAPPPAAAGPGAPAPAAAPGAPPPPAIVLSSGPAPAAGGPPLVPTNAPPPAVMAVGNVGGASAPAVNGGAMPPTSSAPRTAVSAPFPPISF